MTVLLALGLISRVETCRRPADTMALSIVRRAP
jgi:hypothetical protein